MPKLLNKVNLPRYSSAPSTPSEADLYYNTSDDKIYVYTGAAWVEVGSGAGGSGVFYQSSEPSSPSDGDIWIDSDDEVASVTSVTDSTSTTSSTVAASATAVKSAYDLANGAIPKTLTTTTGDIIYASSANTPARLGIGTADQVLSVAAGVPAWTTPAAGGGMTLIATATPSEATSVSFSDIPSTYKHLIVQWKNVSMNSTSGYWNVRINSDTTSSYSWVSLSSNGPANASRSVAGSVGKVVRFGGTNDYTAVIGSTASATTDFSLKAYGRLTINDYSSGSTSKGIESLSFSANGAAIYVNFLGGMYDKTDVVTSVQFVRSASETITGTFYLYGVS
jgi:hypothetical protein